MTQKKARHPQTATECIGTVGVGDVAQHRLGFGDAANDPASSKAAKFADLPRMLKAIEKEHGADDLDCIRPRVLAAIAHYSSSHYRLGRELYGYREALPHGAWYPVVKAISLTTCISERTLHEIVAHYAKVKDTPPEIVGALFSAGIDPAAPRRRDLLASAVGSWVAGVPAKQAVCQAIEVTKRHRAPPSTFPDTQLSERLCRSSPVRTRWLILRPQPSKDDSLAEQECLPQWTTPGSRKKYLSLNIPGLCPVASIHLLEAQMELPDI